MLRFCFVILFVMSLLLVGCEHRAEQEAPHDVGTKKYTIVAMGDSLTAGNGLAEEEAYPAALGRKLAAEGHNVDVVNSGVSGETSSGALARVDWVLTMKPDIVILETGANDGLRGTDTELLEANLRKIIERFQEENVVVVLAGMQMVWNLGPRYVASFNKIYPRLAEDYDLIFFPFFLKDVAMHQELNNGDGIHPNGRGYEIVAENIYPYVVKAINQLDEK